MKKKFLTIVVLGLLIPVLLIGAFLSVVYYRSILSNAYDIVDANMKTHIQVVGERMDTYKSKFYEIVTSNDFQNMAKSLNSEDRNVIISGQRAMTSLFSTNIFSYDELHSIVFLAESGNYALYSKSYGASANSSGIWADPLFREEINSQIINITSLTYFSPFNFNTEQETEKYVIVMSFPVRKVLTQERFGSLLFAINPEILLLKQTEDTGEDGILTVVVDRNECIQACANTKYINHSLNEMVNGIYGDNKAVKRISKDIPGTPWKLVSVVNQSVFQQEIIRQMKVIIALVFLLMSGVAMIVLRISNNYVQRIGTIAEEISNYQAGTGMELEETQTDELNLIVKRFNQMSHRIQSLITEMQCKNQEIVDMTKKQRDAQIKALEAQINPHFLYNTLDAINWRAIENDEEEISNMISMLASLLRYSVSNIDKLVILQAEMEWLKKYMFLQRDRFHDSFDWKYEVTEEAMSFPIHKMLLQPIIENAILHGFEDVKKNGMIWVKAFVREDGRLEISVQDNGKGMTDSELELILEQIIHKNSLDSKSIGISNIINRLWTYYGEEAEISVNSRLGEGTEFVLVIPKLTEE